MSVVRCFTNAADMYRLRLASCLDSANVAGNAPTVDVFVAQIFAALGRASHLNNRLPRNKFANRNILNSAQSVRVKNIVPKWVVIDTPLVD